MTRKECCKVQGKIGIQPKFCKNGQKNSLKGLWEYLEFSIIFINDGSIAFIGYVLYLMFFDKMTTLVFLVISTVLSINKQEMPFRYDSYLGSTLYKS